MKQGAFVLVLCALIVFAGLPPAGAPAGAAPARQPNAAWRDDFDTTGGLESVENLAASSGYLQIPALATWTQDTFDDFYYGSGSGVDLYARPGAVTLSHFTPNRRVNDVTTGLQAQPATAAGPEYLYAAWADGRDGDFDIYFSRSSDAGVNWENARRLDTAAQGDAQHPSLAAAGAKVYAAWEDPAGVHFARSLDLGAAWSDDALVAPAGSRPGLAVYGTAIHLVYLAEESPGDPDVYYRSSTDVGVSWSSPENAIVGEPAGAVQQEPDVVAAGEDLVWVTWQDNRGGDWDAYSARHDPMGTWSNYRVDTGPAGSVQQQPILYLPAGASEPSCLWLDNRGGSNDLYWAEFQPFAWVEKGPLTGPGAGAGSPAVALTGWTTWAGWTAAPPGPADTAWLRRYDGASWGPPLVAPDHLPGVTRTGLALAPASFTTVAALWSDDRADAGDIFVSTSDGSSQSSGVYTSTVHAMGDLAAWGTVSWSGEETDSIVLQLRGGDTPAPDASWTGWLTATNGLTVPLPLGRYLQYRALLQVADSGHSPLLESVHVSAVPRGGYGLSFPIGHCTAAWDHFDAAGYEPAGTTLTLSILDEAGQVLYAGVDAPFDLSAVDPLAYPRLRLRVDEERLEESSGSVSSIQDGLMPPPGASASAGPAKAPAPSEH